MGRWFKSDCRYAFKFIRDFQILAFGRDYLGATSSKVVRIGLQALLFARGHVNFEMQSLPANVFYFFAVLPLGLYLGDVRERNQSLLVPMAIHFLNNVYGGIGTYVKLQGWDQKILRTIDFWIDSLLGPDED